MKRFTLPDWLSIYRIVSVPVLLVLIFSGWREIFAWLFGVSLLTDLIDGFLARRMHVEGKRGAQLDSVGDALTFLTGVIGSWVFEKEFLLEHKFWIIMGLGLYILQIIIAVIRYGRPSSFHTYLAKLAALTQGTFMLLMFFFGPISLLFYLALIVTIIEAIEEIILVFILKEWKTDVKGIYWVLLR